MLGQHPDGRHQQEFAAHIAAQAALDLTPDGQQFRPPGRGGQRQPESLRPRLVERQVDTQDDDGEHLGQKGDHTHTDAQRPGQNHATHCLQLAG